MLELVVHVGLGVDANFVSDTLIDLGALSAVVTDLAAGTRTEQPLFHLASPASMVGVGDGAVLRSRSAPARPPLWSAASISAYIPDGVSAEDVTMQLHALCGLPASTDALAVVDVVPVRSEDLDKDWVLHVHREFNAVRIGRLLVRAPWHNVADDASPVVVVEPGHAFGTGEHPTTQLVVEWLDSLFLERSADGALVGARGRWSVLDYGCGSGILALAALKFGAVTGLGCDLDPSAVETAKVNAQQNGMEGLVQFGSNEFEAEEFTKLQKICEGVEGKCPGYNIVVANIMAGPLEALASLLVTRVVPGGYIGLSGILVEQARALSDVFASHGLEMNEAVVKSGWAFLAGRKPRE